MVPSGDHSTRSLPGSDAISLTRRDTIFVESPHLGDAEKVRLGVGKPPRTGDDFALECGAWREALPDRAEPYPLRLAPRLPLRLGSGARRRSARDRGAGPFSWHPP